MIFLPPAPLQSIRRHAAAAFPDECCGVLGGAVTRGGKRVEAAVLLPNSGTESLDRRYFSAAEAVRRAEKELGVRGLDVIGFYHSHPNAPARPSAYDLANATWPWYSYLIIATRDGRAEEVSSWVLADDRSSFLPEEIELDGAPSVELAGAGETGGDI